MRPQEAVQPLVATSMEAPQIEKVRSRCIELNTMAREMLEKSRAALGSVAAADSVFDASMLTARMLGFVEGIAMVDPELAQELLSHSQAVIDEIGRLSELASKARPHHS
jgi:hypothetical protein